MKPPVIVGVVAALLLALAPQGTAVAAEPAPVSAPHAVPVGNVMALVPGSLVGSNDGIGGLLKRGQTYRAEFIIWVAPNVGTATFDLRATGLTLTDCTAAHLRPGTTSAVMCLVRGAPPTRVSGVSIEVVVRTSNFGTIARTFRHALTS